MHRRFTIQPTEVRQYHQEGFLLKKRFIREELLQQILVADKQAAHQKTLSSDDYGHIYITDDALSKSSEFATLLKSLTLWKAVEALLGSQHLAYHFSSLTIKKPHQDGIIRWHRDFGNRYISLVASDFLRVFIPLTTFNSINSAPTIIRESNRVTDGSVKLLKNLNTRTTRKFPLPQMLCCAPGDVVFMHPKTRHCSEQNDSDNSQINLIMQIGIAKKPVSRNTNNQGRFGMSRLQLKGD